MTGTSRGEGAGYRGALQSRDFRLLATALTISISGGWAYNVALVSVVVALTGSTTWVAISVLMRFVPGVLFSPYAGVIADRFERRRLMIILDLGLAGLQLLLTVVAVTGGHILFVMAIVALSSLLLTVYDPAVAATIPLTVDEEHLAAANALNETIHNLAVLVGPLIGAGLLLLGSEALVFNVNAATYVVSALALSRMSIRSTPVDVTEGGESGPLKQLTVGMKAIFSSPMASVLVGYSAAATLLYGTDTVLFLEASQALGTGSEGYGYFLAGLGTGGILGAAMVARLSRRPRLGLIITVGMGVYCLPTAFLVLVDEPAVAFVLQVIRGGGTLIVDTLAVIALQRSLDQTILARVFGAFYAIILGAIAVGSMLASWLLAVFGLQTTLLLAGTVFPILAVLAYPWLRRSDEAAVVKLERLRPVIEAIEASDLFEDAPRAAVEALADASDVVDLAAGTAFIRQGELADALYLVLEGDVVVHAGAVRSAGTELARLGPGAHVGEIGLLDRVPRTATVVADGPVRVLRIEGDVFVDTLATTTPSSTMLEGARQRRRTTRPATPQMFDAGGGADRA